MYRLTVLRGARNDANHLTILYMVYFNYLYSYDPGVRPLVSFIDVWRVHGVFNAGVRTAVTPSICTYTITDGSGSEQW